jgi:adenylate cyclase
MAQEPFPCWLAARTWRQGVRYSRVVACMLPPAALAVDWPYLAMPAHTWPPGAAALMLWQLCAECFFLAVLAVDRWHYAGRGSERAVNVASASALGLATWAGVVETVRIGDLSIYAAGATFVATVMCTPRPVRRPMYLASLAVLACVFWERSLDTAAFVAGMVNPFCVVVLCIELDRFTHARSLALYAEAERAQAERERADRVLYDVLPVRIADQLKRDGRVDAVRIDNLGVLFADLVGFTSFARRLPPHALVVVLDDIFSDFDALVQQHGAEKIKTMGDGYMATSQGRPEMLCRLALDMQAALACYNERSGTDLAMRIGIHAGPAVAGVLGRNRLLYDVWGETVNVASRLQVSGAAGAIHVSGAVARQAGGAFAFEARPPQWLKGYGPLPSYWLRGAANVAAPMASATVSTA